MARSLLGRDEECRTLDGFVATVSEGLSAALVLIGEAGIGKTRLLDYAASTAADLRIARVAGVESEIRLGFAALHRLLRPFLDATERLPAPQRDALRAAFGLVAGPPPDRFLVGLAVLTLLADLARSQPMICLVDDVQWVDRESAEVLAFVGRRLHADGVGLLMTGRDDLAHTVALDGLSTVHITGLPEAAARELLTGPLKGGLSPETVSRIVSETGGNPLALLELAGELSRDHVAGGVLSPVPLPLSRRLEGHFLQQVQAMPALTQALLLLASAAQSADSAVLWRACALLGLPASAADVAISEGILGPGPELAFRHPLIRSAVYRGAPPEDRRRVHSALAAVTDRDRDPDLRAWHLAEATAGLDETAAAELEGASEHARRRGGYAAVAAFLARTAALTPDPPSRANRSFAAARAYMIAGDPVAAESLLKEAAPGLREPAARAGAERLRAVIEMVCGRMAAAPSILLNAATTIAPLDDTLRRGMLFEALVAAMVARQYSTGTTLSDVARAGLHAPPAEAATASATDLLLQAFASRIVLGYAVAVPLLREAVAALQTDEKLGDRRD